MLDFRIGTRGSKLATTQTGDVRDALAAQGYAAELTIITTPGDRSQAPVERIGVGVFTQALREALVRGECDLAVHSFKDLPTAPDSRLHLICPQRADNREALITRDGQQLADLAEGARVGTGAPRRIAQLRALRPDLEIVPIRGNIDTRMGRVIGPEADLDAVILAAAGLQRVGLLDQASYLFPADEFLPAPAQGVLAVECRANDEAAIAAINTLSCKNSTAIATAERSMLAKLEAGCTAPVAAFSEIQGDNLLLTGGVFAPDGSQGLKATAGGPLTDAVALGERVAAQLFAMGAAEILKG